jgi:hypothetical protein
MTLRNLRGGVLGLLVASLLMTAPLVPVHAVIVGTDQAIALAERGELLARVTEAFMRDDVKAQLEALGVDPQHALERVSALTTEELAALDSQLEALPAGGSLLAVLGAILVVLIVLDLVGVTNVFSRI